MVEAAEPKAGLPKADPPLVGALGELNAGLPKADPVAGEGPAPNAGCPNALLPEDLAEGMKGFEFPEELPKALLVLFVLKGLPPTAVHFEKAPPALLGPTGALPKLEEPNAGAPNAPPDVGCPKAPFPVEGGALYAVSAKPASPPLNRSGKLTNSLFIDL